MALTNRLMIWALGVQAEVAVGERHAKEVEQAEVDRYDYRRSPGG